MFKIYLITNKVNGKVYVGQTSRTLKERFGGHLWGARHGRNNYLSRSIRKHGHQNFSIRQIDFANSRELSNWKESLYIGLIRTNDPRFGYNLTAGGDGVVANNEVRRKLSEKRKGRTFSEEAKENMRLGQLGRKHDEETKNKIREAQKGHTLSKESCQKISVSKTGISNGPHSEATRQKIGDAQRGIPRKQHTEESKLKIAVGSIITNHRHWHTQRNLVSPLCHLCRPDFFDIWEGQANV